MSSRNEASLHTAVKEIKASTGNQQVKYALCDMTNTTDIKRMVQTAVEWNGTVDVLINNAGGPPAGNFADMDDDDWYHAFELNLLSLDRKSTRLNSSHVAISYAVFCLKKIKNTYFYHCFL